MTKTTCKNCRRSFKTKSEFNEHIRKQAMKGNHIVTKLFLIIVCGFFFSFGIMGMDYGASLKDGYGQSLVFDNIPPRILYHAGLIMALASFLIVSALAFFELTKDLQEHRKSAV